jgi:hypothetical protein
MLCLFGRFTYLISTHLPSREALENPSAAPVRARSSQLLQRDNLHWRPVVQGFPSMQSRKFIRHPWLSPCASCAVPQVHASSSAWSARPDAFLSKGSERDTDQRIYKRICRTAQEGGSRKPLGGTCESVELPVGARGNFHSATGCPELPQGPLEKFRFLLVCSPGSSCVILGLVRAPRCLHQRGLQARHSHQRIHRALAGLHTQG